jgi:hypothetical protein
MWVKRGQQYQQMATVRLLLTGVDMDILGTVLPWLAVEAEPQMLGWVDKP